MVRLVASLKRTEVSSEVLTIFTVRASVITLMMEEISASETSISFYETACRNISAQGHFILSVVRI
jgi:hypothetical protein